MTHDISCKIFKNCLRKNNFSVFSEVEVQDVPTEYQKLIKTIKLMLNKEFTINTESLFKFSKDKVIVEKYMEICNKIDKETYRIL